MKRIRCSSRDRHSTALMAAVLVAYCAPLALPGLRDLAHGVAHAIEVTEHAGAEGSGHSHSHPHPRSDAEVREHEHETAPEEHSHDGLAGALLSLDLDSDISGDVEQDGPRVRLTVDVHTAVIAPAPDAPPVIVGVRQPAPVFGIRDLHIDPPDPPPRT